MKRWFIILFAVASLMIPGSGRPAEITEVADAADGDDPIDINIDVTFRSLLNRSKITHEWAALWAEPQYNSRPDFNELRYERQVYAMDYMLEIGLYHDVELYLNLPWIISDERNISYVSGVSDLTSTLYRRNFDPAVYPGNAVVDPSEWSTKRSGIGDMQIGLKWAVFNDERDDTKSVWIIGLDYTIPSGELAQPNQVAGGSEGSVGLGHHVLTPFFLFSRRLKVLDPYLGLHGQIPIQGREAKNAGFNLPYGGGFLAGMEIVPWENLDKHQKFAIDLRLTCDFFGEVESKGEAKYRGTVNEMSDFLLANPTVPGDRQLQAMSNYTQFGLHLGFVVRAAEFVRLRFGVSLAHNSEHFLTGADACKDLSGPAGSKDGMCDAQYGDIMNSYLNPIYDNPGQRVRVEETTLFTWWVMGMMTF